MIHIEKEKHNIIGLLRRMVGGNNEFQSVLTSTPQERLAHLMLVHKAGLK